MPAHCHAFLSIVLFQIEEPFTSLSGFSSCREFTRGISWFSNLCGQNSFLPFKVIDE